MAAGLAEQAVEMTVRRIGDHRTPFTDEKIGKIKQTAYDLVGYKFPLDVEGSVLEETPQMTGQVTAVDCNRILIVDEQAKLGDTDNPDAMWYTFDPSGDSLIQMKDGGGKLTVNQVKIGYSVEAWGEWIALSSYPSQTAGLEINILGADIGEPDLQGTIEEIHRFESMNDQNEQYLVIDGQRVNLLDITQYVEDDHPLSADMLNMGDRVEIWDIGYPNFANQLAATRIERIS